MLTFVWIINIIHFCPFVVENKIDNGMNVDRTHVDLEWRVRWCILRHAECDEGHFKRVGVWLDGCHRWRVGHSKYGKVSIGQMLAHWNKNGNNIYTYICTKVLFNKHSCYAVVPRTSLLTVLQQKHGEVGYHYLACPPSFSVCLFTWMWGGGGNLPITISAGKGTRTRHQHSYIYLQADS